MTEEQMRHMRKLFEKNSTYHLMQGRMGVSSMPEYSPSVIKNTDDLSKLTPPSSLKEKNSSYELLQNRSTTKENDDTEFQSSSIEGVNDLADYLQNYGGYYQQERMIRDKRKSLDKALLYSYQAGLVKKWYPDNMELMEGVREAPPVRALLNPNKLKADYDEKILSIGFEHDFKPGDIFEWKNTGTYWLIYLQELTELAYFRGDCRRCQYKISWKDEDEKIQTTYGSVIGPSQTSISSITRSGNSIDVPNFSVSILIPKNENTLKYFKRYAKFYLQDLPAGADKICWRVEAIDSISIPGVLEVNASEYYKNIEEDDLINDIAGGLKEKEISPNAEKIIPILGEDFIKPKKTYTFTCAEDITGEWGLDDKAPVQMVSQSKNEITLKWTASYSGQFDLHYGNYIKTIIVKSLF